MHSKPPYKAGKVRFTTVPLKGLSRDLPFNTERARFTEVLFKCTVSLHTKLTKSDSQPYP